MIAYCLSEFYAFLSHQGPNALSMAAANAVGSKDATKLPSVAEGAHFTVAGADVPNLGAISMLKAALSDA